MSTLKTNNIQHVDRSDPSILLNSDGSVSMGGTVSYEDVTNVDSVGIITGRDNIDAQKQVHVGTGVSVKAGGINVTAGVSTFQAVTGTTGTFSGALTASSDLDVSEDIRHIGDTDTRIRFETDTISLRTAGNERIRVDSDGKLGINNGAVSSIKAQLDVINTTAPTLDNNTHAGEALFLRSGGSDGNGNVQAVIAFGKADSGSLRSGSAVASVQTDSDADKIGIGFYTSPSSSSSQTLSQKVLITHSGQVGINSASPTYALEVDGGTQNTVIVARSSDAKAAISFLDNTSGGYGRATIGGEGDEVYITSGAGVERLRIDSSGRLLLGLTSDSRTTSMIISGNSSSSTSQSQLHMDFGSTSISNNTTLGIIRFGATGDRRGADIRGVGDGTWSAGSSHPTRLAFYTNDASSSSTPTERLRIDKDGKLSTGAESAPDVGAGGLCLQKGSDSNKAFTIKSTNIAHGVTTYDETDTYFSIGQSSGNKGGAEIRGYTDAAGADPAIRMRGIIASDSDQTYTPLVFIGAEANGTGVQNIAADRRIASFQNSDGTRIVNVTGTGIVFGDTSPAASNALDDYEEGVYAPTLTGSAGGGYSVNSSYNKLAYTKVGRIVHVTGRLRLSAKNSPSGDYIKMTLPTTSNVLTGNGDAGRIVGTVYVQSSGKAVNDFVILPTQGGGAYLFWAHVDFDGTGFNNMNSQMSGDELVSVSVSYVSQ